jgi:hypothetical protein
MIQDAISKASSNQEGKLVTAKPEVAQSFKAIPPKPRLFAIRKKLAGRGVSIFSSAARDSIREFLYKRRRRIRFVMPPPAHLVVHSGGVKYESTDANGDVWVIHEFKSSGTFKAGSTISNATVLCVGGGGAGATSSSSTEVGGGGGGAGEVFIGNMNFSSGYYDVIVGAGGASSTAKNGDIVAANGSMSYLRSKSSFWRKRYLVKAAGGGGAGGGNKGGSRGGSGGGGYLTGGEDWQYASSNSFRSHGSKSDSAGGGGGGGAGDGGSLTNLTVPKNVGVSPKRVTIGSKIFNVGAGGSGGSATASVINGYDSSGESSSSYGAGGGQSSDSAVSNGKHGAQNTGNGGGGAGRVLIETIQVPDGTEQYLIRNETRTRVVQTVESYRYKCGTYRFYSWYRTRWCSGKRTVHKNQQYQHPVYGTRTKYRNETGTHSGRGGSGGSGIVVIAYKKP